MKKLVVLLVVYPLVALLSLRLAAVLAGLSTVGAYFHGAHPLLVVATIAAGFAVASYLLGTITGDYSWVDRLWSTAPVLFAWVHAVRSGLAAAPTTAAVLVTLWGLRLTYNFARRGGYTTMEDYRWPILRERIGSPVLWQLFSLLFISCYQILLFVLFTLPVYRLAVTAGDVSAATLVGFSIAFVAFLLYETVADQQQWRFQSIKHGAWGARASGARASDDAPSWFASPTEVAGAALESDLARGFVTHGLFRLSRHPNYFGELMVWWTLFFLAAVATGSLFDWSAAGALLLTLLFAGSTAFTESISSARYDDYAEYQARTSPIVPWPPGPPAEPQSEVSRAQ